MWELQWNLRDGTKIEQKLQAAGLTKGKGVEDGPKDNSIVNFLKYIQVSQLGNYNRLQSTRDLKITDLKF